MSLKDIFGKKHNNKTLVNQFTAIISISIFTTVIFMSIYYLYATTVLINHNQIDKNNNRDILSSIVFESGIESLNQHDFAVVDKITKKLTKNNLILYAGIIDKSTDKYIWSSVNDWIGTNDYNLNPWQNTAYAKKLKGLRSKDVKAIYKEFKNYKIVTGFFEDNSLVDLINILLSGNVVFVVLFTLMGFAFAIILAKNLTKPIKELTVGAEEFSKGNFKYRAVMSTPEEIVKLAQAFNEMAEKLEILYNSLENQVKERTQELSFKNDQLGNAYKELQETQAMLIHNEKMNSLGQLVAGIAHELNNPINFIYGNLDHLKSYSEQLIGIIQAYEKITADIPSEHLELLDKIKKELDYNFIVEDLPDLLKSCKDGAERCKQIIIDLKNFSRLDEAVVKEVDIHEGIESTLNILSNKFKNRITIHKEYGDLPKLTCYAGQLNQVLMNILDNAFHSIPDKGEVYIKTYCENDNIIMIIRDTGVGIAPENLTKIFDPFFTTKPVGEGTGLGLSISYKVLKKHNGTIEVKSERGKGTAFTVIIPVNGSQKG